MNIVAKTIRRRIALLAALLTLAAMLAGCSKEPSQQEPTTQEPTMIETEAAETTAPQVTTVPEETEVIETAPEVQGPEAGSISYAEYLELTPEEQQAYYANFESPDDFFAWLNPAKEEYAASLVPPETFGSSEQNGDVEEDGFMDESVEDWE